MDSKGFGRVIDRPGGHIGAASLSALIEIIFTNFEFLGIMSYIKLCIKLSHTVKKSLKVSFFQWIFYKSVMHTWYCFEMQQAYSTICTHVPTGYQPEIYFENV